MNHKVNFFIKGTFPELLFFYEISAKEENDFHIFLAYFELWTVLGPFLSTAVKNAKHKKGAPGKNLRINILVPKMRFSKMYIFGSQLSPRGLLWYLLNLSKAHARS